MGVSVVSLFGLFMLSLTLLSSSPSVMVAATAADDDLSLLMIGNNYIDYFDMETMVAKLLEEGGFKEVDAQRIEHSSAKFIEFADAPDIKKTIIERPWKWVLLQEQSEIPAFQEHTLDFEFSKKAAVTLNNWIRSSGASTVLLMTWGRMTYDRYNPDFFKDFDFMQDRLRSGYEQYANILSTTDRTVTIAPAGLAFKAIHQEILYRNEDPSKPENDFTRLYENNDEAHLGYPSIAGSYLTACVIYGTLTGGKDVSELSWTPKGLDDQEYAKRLRSVAAKAVAEYKYLPDPPTPAPYIPHDSSSYASSEQALEKKRTSVLFKFILLAMFASLVYYVALPAWRAYRVNGYYSHNSRAAAPQSDYEMPYIQVELHDHDHQLL